MAVSYGFPAGSDRDLLFGLPSDRGFFPTTPRPLISSMRWSRYTFSSCR